MTDPKNLSFWSFPTRVVVGEGAAATCAQEAQLLGGERVLLVSDATIEETGLLERVRAALATAGLPRSTSAR